jgi:predicted TIM-barrel fold metal-dependent hydrolase
LDDAGIRQAVVLSVAYQWGSSESCPNCTKEQEYAHVKAENDYIARQIAKYPDRLTGFCSFNPLKDYATEELTRCSKLPGMKGLKLHFGNSRVDLRISEHVQKIRSIFHAANQLGIPIVVHLWTDSSYEQNGGQRAQIFLDQILPEAPDVTIQIAHMAGGGRATFAALAVFAEAFARTDPRIRNLYFDTATITDGETREGLQQDATFMRKIGMTRILYGTDTAPPNPPPRVSWALFRSLVPLTDAEFRIIASNRAPYFR